MEEQKLIYKIEDVKVGDYAHYKGYTPGLKVTRKVQPYNGASLAVEMPKDLFLSEAAGQSVFLEDSAFLFATRGYDDLEKENQVSESDKITNINEVQVGDIAYFEGVEKGTLVVSLDPEDSSRLEVEAPEEYKPFNIDGDTSVWLQNSSFRYAIRPTQNKLVEKRLPDVQVGQTRMFETQSQTRIIYDGSKFRSWIIESFLSDEQFLELLDPSQFPLKDITEEKS